MTLPKWSTTVTPFSKMLAIVMFVFFPILGFVLGMQYQKVMTEPKVQYITKEKFVKSNQKDTERDLLRRCGKYPDIDLRQNTEFTQTISGPYWSPDCRYIAWSLSEPEQSFQLLHSLGKNNQELTGQEGVYIYSEVLGKKTQLYTPKKLFEETTFQEWVDKNTLEFTTTEKKYHYDLRDKSTIEVK